MMCASDQFQRERATTAKSSDVIAIVPVTAMPYAAPRFCDDLEGDDEHEAARSTSTC